MFATVFLALWLVAVSVLGTHFKSFSMPNFVAFRMLSRCANRKKKKKKKKIMLFFFRFNGEVEN
jgi:hypothetical protein